MAADANRLAAALAYEDERKRRLAETIPALTGPTTAPRRSVRTDLENLSAGLGQGITTQLEGIKGLITDPVGTAKGAYEAARAVVRDPSVLAAALSQMGQKAMSGPLGAGEVIGEMIGPRKTGPVMAELDVYHGTPHRFPATEANPLGEFDASKIGTGEGAQAYGHGVYLAESPGVANAYKTALEAGKGDRDEDVIARLLAATKGDRAAAAEEFRRRAEFANYPEGKQRMLSLAEKVESGVDPRGSLYKADLPDEMIDRMLDWDKPLSEQPENVKKALKKLPAFKELQKTAGLRIAEGRNINNWSGSFIHRALQDQAGNLNMTRNEISAVLRQAGIPGIKYLDAGSRGQGGSGTRNFVVFPGEEKKVRILERDGQKAPPQKIAQALEATPDYRMSHRPLKVEGGAAQLNKAYEVFGQDIYGPNALQYFGAGDPREAKTVAALKRLRDNPDAEVTIYRGVPADATGGIAKGDWVTLDKDVAQDYANLKPGQKGKVLTMKVKAKDVTTWPDSLLEFGYYPAE